MIEIVDLNDLYQEVLNKYYKTRTYTLPTISWSQEYWWGRFGEFQGWKNHIMISRLMNTNEISKEAIMSVIYHELLHQDNGDHDDKFLKKLEKFSNYYEYQKELENFFDSIELPKLNPPNEFGKDRGNIVFCLLRSDKYFEDFVNYNKKVYVDVGSEKPYPEEVTKADNPFIIWLVLQDKEYYVVGWSDTGKFFSNQQKINHSPFGGLDLTYQIMTKSENCYMLAPGNCFCTINKSYLPASFKKTGIWLVAKNIRIELQEILNHINSYSGEFETIGLQDYAIHSVYPLREEDPNKIISRSLKDTCFRSLWMANLAVQKEKNYNTLFNQGDSLRYAGVLDNALEVFEKAMLLEMKEEAAIAAIKVCVMLGKIERAKELLKKVKKSNITKDPELKKCVEVIS